jgi:AcrR family transcriptional regulator
MLARMGKAPVTAPPSGRRIRRTPEQAEQEILDAAEEYLREHDFRDLAVEDVMRRTGMKRSAFYNYFKDRNDLIMRLLQRLEAAWLEDAAVWLQSQGEPGVALIEGLRRVTLTYAGHRHMLRAIHEASYHDREIERYYRGVIDDLIRMVARQLRAQKRAGLTDIENPTEVARALVLMNAEVMFERLGREPPARPADVAKVLQRVWTRTIYNSPA